MMIPVPVVRLNLRDWLYGETIRDERHREHVSAGRPSVRQ
jgi:hypothetical protein